MQGVVRLDRLLVFDCQIAPGFAFRCCCPAAADGRRAGNLAVPDGGGGYLFRAGKRQFAPNKGSKAQRMQPIDPFWMGLRAVNPADFAKSNGNNGNRGAESG